MRILVVEDDRLIQEAFGYVFPDHAMTVEATGEEALKRLGEVPYNILFLDIKLAGQLNGIDVLKHARQIDPLLPIIMTSGLEDRTTITECLELGAVDYLVKGSINSSAYKFAVHKASVWRSQQAQNRSHRQIPEKEMAESFSLIKGHSQQTRTLCELISVVGKTDGPFLIQGETGTGKELVARSLWQAMGNKNRPYITVNCAELQASTIEGELFGHEKGSFTGADSQRVGLFEAAHGGDIFLDEIGELPFEFQSKLLRVIQEKKIRRMGSTIERVFDFRVIAATNRNLQDEIRQGRFRSDLYYRLDVHTLSIKPLRERREDILELLEFYLGSFGFKGVRICGEVRDEIRSFSWPGNVRQLVAFAKQVSPRIDLVDPYLSIEEWRNWSQKQPQSIDDVPLGPQSKEQIISLIKEGSFHYDSFSSTTRRGLIEAAMGMTQNNRTAAARMLGVSRQRLCSWIDELGSVG